MRSATPGVAGLLLTLFAARALPAAAPDLDEIAERLDRATLDFSGAVGVDGVEIALDYGALVLERGALVPVRVAGEERPFELVFLGSGRLRLDPPDDVEAQQIEFFTGRRRIDAPVGDAILVRGDGGLADLLAGRPRVDLTPPQREGASRLLGHWIQDAQREGFDARTALIKALAGDALGAGFFGAWIQSAELGPVFYRVDPADEEPVAAGRFRLVHEDDLESNKERRFLRWKERRERRQGFGAYAPEGGAPTKKRECGVDVGEDVDENDNESWPWVKTWMSTHRRDADPAADRPGVEPSHYAIELTLRGPSLDGRGTASIRLAAGVAGMRVVPLSLEPMLEVCEVLDDQDHPLPFYRDGSAVLVSLREPTEEGGRYGLTVRFAGRPVRHYRDRRTLRSTTRWYPRAGHRDAATYDVTLRWPEGLQLLGSGTPLGGGAEDGLAWTRYAAEIPIRSFSFEVDEFDLVQDSVGHIELRFAFHKRDEELAEERRAEIVRAAKAALLFFESQLGPLPIDRLSVVSRQRGFSQGLLGLVTLAEGALHGGRDPFSIHDNRSAQQVRLETIAHEISHQWWGHVVAWDGYRDQWLSEALADFSAATFLAKLTDAPADHWRRHAELWRTALQAETFGGQPLGSVGGVTLGRRLWANHGLGAYATIVYQKGAAVFGTLTQRLGTEPTWRMLGTLARAVNGRTIRTSTFFRALEHMSGHDLSGFVGQYVTGTGMPALFYEHEFAPDPAGGWRVEGRVRQLPGEQFRLVVRRTGEGWDVVRRSAESKDGTEWATVVPFQVETATSGGGEPDTIDGSLTVRGESSQLSIPVANRPLAFRFDPYGMILARFHSREADPKRYLYELGRHLARLGRAEEAEQTLARALSAGGSADAGHLDAEIRLARARLFLDQQEASRARTELRQAESLLPRHSDAHAGERAMLRARLELRSGAADVALLTLQEFLRNHALEMNAFASDLALDSERFRKLRVARGELLALLAAIHVERGGRDAVMLARMADDVGVDVGALGVL